MKYYTAKGVIRYKGDWVIVEAPRNLVNYYRFWVEKFLGKKTSTSYHGAHISVVAGKHESGASKHPNWGKYEGKVVEFKYWTQIHTDHPWFFKGQYFWLRVECPFLEQLRTELDLKPNLKWPFHLTVCFCGY